MKRFLGLLGKPHGSDMDEERATSTPMSMKAGHSRLVLLPWCCSRSQEPAAAQVTRKLHRIFFKALPGTRTSPLPIQEKRAAMQFTSLQQPILHHVKCPTWTAARRAPPQTRPPRPCRPPLRKNHRQREEHCGTNWTVQDLGRESRHYGETHLPSAEHRGVQGTKTQRHGPDDAHVLATR